MGIPIPISNPKLLPFQREAHGNSMGMGIPIPMEFPWSGWFGSFGLCFKNSHGIPVGMGVVLGY